MIQERIVQHPNMRKIVKKNVSGHTNTDDDFYAEVSIGGEGNVTQTGTLITAELLNGFAQKSDLVNLLYPVGAIYISTSNTNPGNFLGGNWQAWGQGRVPVGIGSNGETNYTSAEKTGGSENSVAQHNHSIGDFDTTRWFSVASFNTQSCGDGVTMEETTGSRPAGSGSGRVKYTISLKHTHTIAKEGSAGGNMQPFITCYMWKRTA